MADPFDILAKPYAAFELPPGGAEFAFDDISGLAAWALDRKGALKLSVRDTHLVWGAEPHEERAAVTLELRPGDETAAVQESWRLLTQGQKAGEVLDAIKFVRARRKLAA